MEFTFFQWKYFYRKLTRVVQYSWHESCVPVRPIQAIETAPKGFQSLEVVKRCQSGHNCFFCQRVAIVSLNYGKTLKAEGHQSLKAVDQIVQQRLQAIKKETISAPVFQNIVIAFTIMPKVDLPLQCSQQFLYLHNITTKKLQQLILTTLVRLC